MHLLVLRARSRDDSRSSIRCAAGTLVAYDVQQDILDDDTVVLHIISVVFSRWVE